MEARPPGPGEPFPPFLGERQRAALAIALTLLAAIVIVGTVVGLAWLLALFFRAFANVFLPLVVAAVAALVFAPYYRWLHDKLRIPKPLALVVVFLSILMPLVAFGWFFGALALEQLTDLLSRIPEWWQATWAAIKAHWPQVEKFVETHPWVQQLRTVLQAQQGTIFSGLQSVGGTALSIGAVIVRGLGSLVAWAVLPVYFAFFLMAESRKSQGGLDAMLPFLKPETRADVVYLMTEFVNIVVAFFRGQLIIAFLQGLLFAVGFSLIDLRYGFVLGLLLGLLNIIPYLGSMIGLGIGLPLAYFQRGLGLVVAVLVVFTLVQLIEAYVLTPRIMGRRTGLHPMAIIVAVFFWGTALEGILGLILAVPLTAFLVVCWRLARDKYIAELL